MPHIKTGGQIYLAYLRNVSESQILKIPLPIWKSGLLLSTIEKQLVVHCAYTGQGWLGHSWLFFSFGRAMPLLVLFRTVFVKCEWASCIAEVSGYGRVYRRHINRA